MKYKSKTNASLGRSLIKNQRKAKPANTTERHTTDDQTNTKSVTENTSLEEFLSTAELTNKQFTAERERITLLNNDTTATTSNITWTAEELEKELLIPRRPPWDSNTTAEELKLLENENYLKWRRKLADLQERDDVILTPFEKNLEFWRQLWRVIERSDILVQILDARNPLMFHCEDLDRYIKEVDKNKFSVILLNKADYLTESQRHDWINYFTSIGKTCVFFSALEQQSTSESDQTMEDDADTIQSKLSHLKIQTDLCTSLSYTELICYFKSLKPMLGLSESKSGITVGLVGYPNVGKSSTINALLRAKRVSVSAMPGKTKHFQTIILDDEITICDCPGLVFPNVVSSKAEMIINGILPIDQMKDAIPPVSVIVSKIPAHVFESLYGILLMKSEESPDSLDRKVTALELLSTYGYSRGFMTQRGLPDTSRAARYILKDFVTGKLLFCYAPPNIDQEKYHFYPKKESGSNEVSDKKLARIYEANNIVRKDFDKEFFQSQTSGVHTKGFRGVPKHSREFSQMGSVSSEAKPWKKHNNRNKKEKLRKVYAHLDD